MHNNITKDRVTIVSLQKFADSKCIPLEAAIDDFFIDDTYANIIAERIVRNSKEPLGNIDYLFDVFINNLKPILLEKYKTKPPERSFDLFRGILKNRFTPVWANTEYQKSRLNRRDVEVCQKNIVHSSYKILTQAILDPLSASSRKMAFFAHGLSSSIDDVMNENYRDKSSKGSRERRVKNILISVVYIHFNIELTQNEAKKIIGSLFGRHSIEWYAWDEDHKAEIKAEKEFKKLNYKANSTSKATTQKIEREISPSSNASTNREELFLRLRELVSASNNSDLANIISPMLDDAEDYIISMGM